VTARRRAADPFVHPAALVESRRVGAGTRIWAFAHVMAGAVIGRDCNVGDHAFIESGARVGHGVTIKNGVQIWEGVTIGDEAFLGPAVVFTNDLRPRSPRAQAASRRYQEKAWLVRTRVGRGASLGANAAVVCGVRIGAYAMVGAGAVVTGNVPPHALWLGVPGRWAGWVCECGEPLAFEQAVGRCGVCRKRFSLRRGRVSRVR
jgi:UDP-2-acetamido-3-amino-2,3-dideoxy-glucuronate N-acetyltransferase